MQVQLSNYNKHIVTKYPHRELPKTASKLNVISLISVQQNVC